MEDQAEEQVENQLEEKPETGNKLFDISVEVYQGPLDLLLELIRENKVDIYDIPISEITDQYLERLTQMKELNLVVAGEFMVLAATLIYIKSRMLLPDDVEEEEDEEGLDPREELIQKLLDYQSFKEAARDLDLLQNDRGKVSRRDFEDYRINTDEDSSHFQETITDNLYELIQAFSGILAGQSIESFHEIYEEQVPIEVKIEYVKQILALKDEVLFTELFDRRRSRNELIATFLALLELIKVKYVRIEQTDHFSTITIKKL